MSHIKLLSSLFLLLMTYQVSAIPFSSCPSKAFLIQQSVAQLYGVNLVTGNYELLSDDLGTTGKINGSFSLSGTVNQPRANGELNITDGGISLSNQGVVLEDIRLTLDTEENGARARC